MTRFLIPGLVGAATGLVAFGIGLHVTFPDDDALARLKWEIQDRSGGGYALEASDLDLWWLTGVQLDDATLYRVERPRRRGRTTEEPPPPTALLGASQFNARLQLLPAITGALIASFDADLYGGEVSGEAGVDGPVQRLELDGEDLDLSLLPLYGEGWSVELGGKAQIEADVSLDTDEIRNSEGSVSIEIDGLAIQGGEAGGLTLDPMPFSEAVLKLELKDGTAEITEGRFVSEMVDATIAGEIGLMRDLRRSRIRITITLRLSDTLDTLARMAPATKYARDEDGVYHFIYSGTPGLARVREDRDAAAGEEPRRGPLGGGGPMGGELGGQMGGPMGGAGGFGDREPAEGGDDDDRRAERLERIRRARERFRESRESDAGGVGEREPMRPGADRREPQMDAEDFGPDDRELDQEDWEDDPQRDELRDLGPEDEEDLLQDEPYFDE